MADGSFGYKIVIDSKSGEASLERLTGDLKKQETQTKKTSKAQATLGARLKSLTSGATDLVFAWRAVSGAVKAVTGKIGEFIELSNIQRDAEAMLTAKVGEGAEALIEYAGALQKVTTFGDEMTLKGMASLSYFNLSTQAIKALTPTMLDMAAAGINMKTGAELMGKAMKGEFGTLSRYGIILDDVQKNILKVGTEEQKTAVLTEALGKKFGGLSEKMAQTASGAGAQLSNVIGDLKEKMGDAFTGSDVLTAGIQAMTLAFEKINVNGGKASEVIGELAIGAVEFFSVVMELLSPLIRLGRTLWNVSEMAWTLASALGLAATGTVSLTDATTAAKEELLADWEDMKNAWESDTVADRIAANANKIRDAMNAARGKGGGADEDLAQSKAAASQAENELQEEKIENTDELKDAMTEAAVEPTEEAKETFDQLWEASEKGAGDLNDSLDDMLDTAIDLRDTMAQAFGGSGWGSGWSGGLRSGDRFNRGFSTPSIDEEGEHFGDSWDPGGYWDDDNSKRGGGGGAGGGKRNQATGMIQRNDIVVTLRGETGNADLSDLAQRLAPVLAPVLAPIIRRDTARRKYKIADARGIIHS